MFGMGRKKSRNERMLDMVSEKSKYKKELSSLNQEEKMLKMRDDVSTKRKAVKERRAAPRKEAFKKFAKALKGIKESRKSTGGMFGSTQSNRVFSPSESNSVFGSSAPEKKKTARRKYKEVYYKWGC